MATAELEPSSSQDIDLTSPNIKPTYSRLRMGVIQITPESMKCKLYCRGVNCKYCTSTGWSDSEQAIHGLYSSWITNDLLAMARPTETAIAQFDLMQQFKNQNVKTVINLQTAHEHAFCGPPLHSSGFSYDPELIMRHKIYFYNYAIPDFGTANVYSLLDIAKVMWFASRQGKIAVHCHAGLGRTCTLIACYLVWSTGMTAERAIGIVRAVRPKAIQSPKQILIVQQFATIILKYATTLPSELNLPFSRYLMMQNDFLPGEQSRRYCHIPKVVFIISDLLLRQIFEDGIKYSLAENEKHNVRACTMGKLSVDWKNAFTAKGKARTRYIINLFARVSAFPFEKDEDLEWKFKHLSVVNLESRLVELEPKELIYILNCFMESPHRPYCSRKEMIKTLKKHAPAEQEPMSTNAQDSANLLSVPAENGLANQDVTTIFDSWQCMIFFLCNVLSYLMGENYDIVVELVTVWLLNEMDEEVKAAVHSHMRDLFARNLREQEQQSRLLKRKPAIKTTGS